MTVLVDIVLACSNFLYEKVKLRARLLRNRVTALGHNHNLFPGNVEFFEVLANERLGKAVGEGASCVPLSLCQRGGLPREGVQNSPC